MFTVAQEVHQYSPHFYESLHNKESFDLVGVAFEHDLGWHGHITSIATSAAKKLGFLFRTARYFSSLNLYTLYIFQIRPCLEYCCHVWGAAPPSILGILDFIQTFDLLMTQFLLEDFLYLLTDVLWVTFPSSTDISTVSA